MEQTWALGTVADSPREVEIINLTGERSIVLIEQAVGLGVPKLAKTQRHVFEGDFASWRLGSAQTYLAGVGLDLPADVENRHDVFTFAINEKLTAYVPALVLMRAFFKPHYCVLSAVFRPTSLDALSFVDYCQDHPVVVLDNVPERGTPHDCRGVMRCAATMWIVVVQLIKHSWSTLRQEPVAPGR